MDNAYSPTAWWVEARQRMSRHPIVKGVGTTAFMSLFFVAYFHVLRHPLFPVVQMPVTTLDRWIGFYPPALLAYASLWLYVGIPPALLGSFRELLRYGLWIAALCGAGLLCFLLWPTAIPAQAPGNPGFPGFQILAGVDAKANACPSLHVATALFSALWLNRLLGEIGAPAAVRAGNWLWFVLIVYSTLAIKQHVALDALAGLLLGTLFGLPSLRHRSQPLPAPQSPLPATAL